MRNTNGHCLESLDLNLLHTVKWSYNVQSLYPNIWHVGSGHSNLFLQTAGIHFKIMPNITKLLHRWPEPKLFESDAWLWSSAAISSKCISFIYNLWQSHETWPNTDPSPLQVDWLYYLAFAIVVVGLILYSTTYVLNLCLKYFLLVKLSGCEYPCSIMCKFLSLVSLNRELKEQLSSQNW